MEQILNHIFSEVEEKEIINEALELTTNLKEKHHLQLKGGTSCWVGNKYVYTFIFEDTSDIASIELPIYKMDKEEQLQFTARQNNRSSQLYGFLYTIMDEVPGDIQLSDITNNIITITCTMS